jgi:hypothetical protein
VAHSQAYSTAWERVRETGYDSFSEIPRDELDGEDCKAKGFGEKNESSGFTETFRKNRKKKKSDSN